MSRREWAVWFAWAVASVAPLGIVAWLEARRGR